MADLEEQSVDANAVEELNLFREEWKRSLKEDSTLSARAQPSACGHDGDSHSSVHHTIAKDAVCCGNDDGTSTICSRRSDQAPSSLSTERGLIDLLNLPDPTEEVRSHGTDSTCRTVPEPPAKWPKNRFVDMLIADWDEINEIPFFDINIPRELAVKIFQHLDPRSLCRCSQVSYSWRSLADDEVLWYRVAQDMGFATGQSITDRHGWKAFVRQQVLHRREVEQNWRERKCGVLKLSNPRDGCLTCAVLHEPYIAAGYSGGNVHLWGITSEPQACVLSVPPLPGRTVPLAAEGHGVKCVAVGQAVVAAGSSAPILSLEGQLFLHQVTVWDASNRLPVLAYSADFPVRNVAVDTSTSSVAAVYGASVRVDGCSDVGQWMCLANVSCGETDNPLNYFSSAQFMQPVQSNAADGQRLLVSTGCSLSLFLLHHPSCHVRPKELSVRPSLASNEVSAGGGPLHTFERPVGGRNVSVMAFDSTASHVVTATTGYGIDALCEGSQVRVHDAIGGGLVVSIATARSSCLSIGDATCSEIVTGSFDHRVRVFDVRSASRVLCLSGSSSCVTAVQIDDDKVVSGSANGVVHVWDRRNGLLLWETYASDPVSLCQFTRTQLVTANIPSCDVTSNANDGVDLLFRRRHMGSLMLYDFDMAEDAGNVLDICKSTYDMPGASSYNLDLIVPYADDH